MYTWNERTLLWDRIEEKFVDLPEYMGWMEKPVMILEHALQEKFGITNMEWGVYPEEGECLLQPERCGDVDLIDDIPGIYVKNVFNSRPFFTSLEEFVNSFYSLSQEKREKLFKI